MHWRYVKMLAARKPLTMSGIFAPLAYDFLEFKRTQGYKYEGEEKVLQRFCRFTEDYHLEKTSLTKELVLDWISKRENEAAKSRAHRITCVNQFGNYLKSLGYEVFELPPQKHLNVSSFTPYIFSHDEIVRLFKAADNVQPVTQSREMHKLLPVLMRTLYSSGLRVSEALKLKCADVNLHEGILTLRDTKFGKDRLIPMSNTLLNYYRQYYEEIIYWAYDYDYFFMAPDRTMLSPNTIYQRFRRLLLRSDIPYNGKGYGPRLHDLRHTFAVHTLQKWVEAGKDLSAMLPVLSVYMGHKSLKATSRYLRLTAEVYPNVIRQVETTCAHIIPGGDA